jgi:DNA-binding response OmpR family regulator
MLRKRNRDFSQEAQNQSAVAKILVIDDDPMMLELYREILTRGGHHVVLAENGLQGLARAGQDIELIVVDLMMPNLNGYDFLKQLRASDGSSSRPIIAASGLGSGDLAVQAGADRFLGKPFKSRELTALVTELLGGDA